MSIEPWMKLLMVSRSLPEPAGSVIVRFAVDGIDDGNSASLHSDVNSSHGSATPPFDGAPLHTPLVL